MTIKPFPFTAVELAKRLFAEVDRLDADYRTNLPGNEGTFWTRSMKQWLCDLGEASALRTISTGPGTSEFLLDLVWWQDRSPRGAVLACEMEWGNTRDPKKNPGRVLEDFEKLMSFKAPFKLMLFDSYNHGDRHKEMVARMEDALRDFADHRKGEDYLLFDVSPLRQAWHFAVYRDGADAKISLHKLELRDAQDSPAPSVTRDDSDTQDVRQEFDEFLDAIAERVRTLRLTRGLTLRDMVVRHGYHDSNYRWIEREGVSNISRSCSWRGRSMFP